MCSFSTPSNLAHVQRAETDINEDWLEQVVSNDEDLFNGLVQQCDTNQDTENMNSECITYLTAPQ